MGGVNIDGLTYRYRGRDTAALDAVSLEIPDGGIFGLLGPNGAGKTTLISLLAGQLHGAAGRITVAGEPLEQLRRRRPQALGLVPQEYAFYPMLSCLENLRFFAGIQGQHGAHLARRVEAVTAFARIEAVLRRRAGELSGGLRRRLNLAIGLLTEPDILLLDEPTVGVDPQSRAFLLDSIRALAGAGKVIVYTSHYMEEVQAICDRVAIIDQGRVLLAGPLAEVLQESSGLLTLRLRRALPESLAAGWRTRHALQDDGEARYSLRIGNAAELARALDEAQAAGCEPLAVAYGQRDLEHLFMQLTHHSLRDE